MPPSLPFKPGTSAALGSWDAALGRINCNRSFLSPTLPKSPSSLFRRLARSERHAVRHLNMFLLPSLFFHLSSITSIASEAVGDGKESGRFTVFP